MGVYFNNNELDVLWSKLVCATQAICDPEGDGNWDGSYSYTAEDGTGNKWICGECEYEDTIPGYDCEQCGNTLSFLNYKLANTGIEGIHDALLSHFDITHDNTPKTPGDYMKGIAVAARYRINGNTIDTETKTSLEGIVELLKQKVTAKPSCSYCDLTFDSEEDFITRHATDGYTYYYHYDCAKEVGTSDPTEDCAYCGANLTVFEEYMYGDRCTTCGEEYCDHPEYRWVPYGDNRHVYKCTECDDTTDSGECYNDTGGYCICGRKMVSSYEYYDSAYHKTSSGELEAHYDYDAPTCICGADPCSEHGGYWTTSKPCPYCTNGTVECPGCNERFPADELVDGYCSNCRGECDHAGASLESGPDDMGDYHEYTYYCVNCDTYFTRTEDHSYDSDGLCECGASSGYRCDCPECGGDQCGNYVYTEGYTCNWCQENCLGGGDPCNHEYHYFPNDDGITHNYHCINCGDYDITEQQCEDNGDGYCVCGREITTVDVGWTCLCGATNDSTDMECIDCGCKRDNCTCCEHVNTGRKYSYEYLNSSTHTVTEKCEHCGATLKTYNQGHEYGAYEGECWCGAEECSECNGGYLDLTTHTCGDDDDNNTWSCNCGETDISRDDDCPACGCAYDTGCNDDPNYHDDPTIEESKCPVCESTSYSGNYCEECGDTIYGFSCPNHPTSDDTHYMAGDSGSFTCKYGCECRVEAGTVYVDNDLCPLCGQETTQGMHYVGDCGFDCSGQDCCGYWDGTNFYCYVCGKWTTYGD